MATDTAQARTTLDPNEWVDRHGDVLYRFALARLRDPHLAENAVQDTFLAALRAQEGFGGRSSERTWLVGILKRKVIDHFRGRRREESVEDASEAHDATRDLFDERGRWKIGPAEWGRPETPFERAEFLNALDLCLEDLSPRLREAFVLREIDEVATDEVCEAMSVKANNLWVMLHRARAGLRRCLELGWFGSHERGSGEVRDA